MFTIHVQYNTWCQWRLGVPDEAADADADDGGDTSDAEGDNEARVTDDAYADDDICIYENADELS